MMRRYRTAIAAGLAALAAVISLVLLLTSPWSSGSTQVSTTLRPDAGCDRDVVVDDDGVFDLKWAAPSLLFGDCTPVLAPRLRTPTPTPTRTATPTPPPTPAPTDLPPPTASVTPSPAPAPATYTLQQVLQDANVDLMIDFAVIPGTNGQQAVVITQDGFLWRISLTGAFQRTQFGDVHNLVNCCGEQGLLSLAFSPNYASDRLLYLYYTRANGNQNVCDAQAGQCSFIGRFTVTNNSMGPQPDNIVLRVIEPAPNHNGGKLLFGGESPTPYLYLGLGDGGGGGDQYGNGQNTGTILGSIIRIDVSSGEAGYEIPPDNPFAQSAGADEIYAWGLRNPWRMSFDRETGQLWVGDVGQGAWEEVDNVTKGGNYGWPCYEGDAAYDLAGCGAIGQYEFPRAVYANSSPDCAIVGGYVYRGAALPQLRGWYIFSDNCSGRIRGFDTAAGGPPQVLYDSPYAVSSLAELPNGELLVLTFNNAVFQLVAD